MGSRAEVASCLEDMRFYAVLSEEGEKEAGGAGADYNDLGVFVDFLKQW